MVRKSKDKQLVEQETIGYMPERFITAYNELVRIGLLSAPLGQSFDNQSSMPKKRFHEHAGGLKDEKALRFKAWVDRQLRAVGRDIQAYLNVHGGSGPSPIGISEVDRREIAREIEQKTELKCQNVPECGKYVSWQWRHCPWCGKELKGVTKSGTQAPAGTQQHASGKAGTDAARQDGAEAGPDIPRAPGQAARVGSRSGRSNGSGERRAPGLDGGERGQDQGHGDHAGNHAQHVDDGGAAAVEGKARS